VLFRALRGVALCAAVCVTGLAMAAPAGAAPVGAGPGASQGCIATACLKLSGTAPEPQVGPGGSVQFDYQMVVPSGVTVTSFTAHDDAQLLAVTSTVQLDGAGVAASAIQLAAPDLTITAAAFTGLAAGTHHLTFSANAAADASGTTTSWAEAALTETAPPSGTPPATAKATSADVPVQITPRPVNLGLQGGATLPDPLTVARTGGQVIVSTSVVNSMDQATPAVLTVTSPAATAAAVSVNTPAKSACARATAPASFTCPVGTVQPQGIANVTAYLTVGAGAIGTAFPINLTVAPSSGTDSTPGDNTISLTGTWVGIVHLRTDISPGPDYDGYHPPQQVQPVRLPLGASQDFVVTVANAGPDPALTATVSVVLLADPGQFQVTWPGNATNISATSAGIPLGNLPVGTHRSVSVQIKSLGMLATATLGEFTTAKADIVHPTCTLGAGCRFDTAVRLSAVTTPSTSAAASTAIASAASSPVTAHIADTGVPTLQLALLAAAGLGLGGLLLGLTRRRRSTTREEPQLALRTPRR
jgi:hypothetical protein